MNTVVITIGRTQRNGANTIANITKIKHPATPLKDVTCWLRRVSVLGSQNLQGHAQKRANAAAKPKQEEWNSSALTIATRPKHLEAGCVIDVIWQ